MAAGAEASSLATRGLTGLNSRRRAPFAGLHDKVDGDTWPDDGDHTSPFCRVRQGLGSALRRPPGPSFEEAA